MLHTKSQGHRTPGSGVEDLQGFIIYLQTWPSYSCDQNSLNINIANLSQEVFI